MDGDGLIPTKAKRRVRAALRCVSLAAFLLPARVWLTKVRPGRLSEKEYFSILQAPWESMVTQMRMKIKMRF